jgi:hypothetical protein
MPLKNYPSKAYGGMGWEVYAFDPRRAAILLLGGDKTGQDRWYEQHVPEADDLYDDYLAALTKENLL